MQLDNSAERWNMHKHIFSISFPSFPWLHWSNSVAITTLNLVAECVLEKRSSRGVGGCITEIPSLILFWNDDMTAVHSQAQDLPDVLTGFFIQRVCNQVRKTLLCFQIQVICLVLSSGDDH